MEQELAKVTPADWEEHSELLHAISCLKSVIKGGNELTRSTDSLMEALELQNRFVLFAGVRESLPHGSKYSTTLLTGAYDTIFRMAC